MNCAAARISEYIAPGDAANTELPAGSVDIYFSHAVLEHVPDRVVHQLVQEARRVLKPGGCFYALIGLARSLCQYRRECLDR